MKYTRMTMAWHAAYWMARSEARRQQGARLPDCNWRQVEASEECASAVVAAQAALCMQAMERTVRTNSAS